MIHTFNNARKIFFFPVRWANAVSNWCLGLNSPSGTIRVKNTANPTESGAEIDVDIPTVASRVGEWLRIVFVSVSDFFDNLTRHIDGASIVSENGTIRVSEDWVKRISDDGSEEEEEEEEETDGVNVTNLIVYQIYRPNGQYNYYGIPYTLEFTDGKLTGITAGNAVNLNGVESPNVPVITTASA